MSVVTFGWKFQFLLLIGCVASVASAILAFVALLWIAPIIADRGWMAGVRPVIFILFPFAQIYGLVRAADWYRSGLPRRAAALVIGQLALVAAIILWADFL